MNKEQQTIAAIQKAVSDIMELKFGCELKDKTSNKSWKFIGMHLGNCVLLSNEKWSAQMFKYNLLDVFGSLDKIEIIGRPITLEDVLVAIHKAIDEDKISHSDGYSHIINLCYMSERTKWIPNKPFTEQSKETKDLIGDLILK